MTAPSSGDLSLTVLHLRAFAHGVFSGHPLSPATEAAAVDAPAVAWRAFLRAESCATPLARALRAAGWMDRLDDAARAEIAARALVETQRILTARWQLRSLDTLLARESLGVCVVKGGALILDEVRAVDLGDLDLLVTREDAPRVAALLVEMGMYASPVAERERSKHLPPFHGAGMLSVELHTRLRYGGRLATIAVEQEPLPGAMAVQRWAGWHAARGFLVHAAESHPQRCGQVRDTLLLCDLLHRLGTDARVALDEWVTTADQGPVMQDMLRLADSVREGREPVDSARLRAIASQRAADLSLPASARLRQLMRARPAVRYLTTTTPWPAAIATVGREMLSELRDPAWRPSALPAAVARPIGGFVSATGLALHRLLMLADGARDQRRAWRAVARADQVVSDNR